MLNPFRLSPEQFDHLRPMRDADRRLALETLAQAHHYRTFPILGSYRSLDGIPQMAEWERRRDELVAEANAEFARCLAEAWGVAA
jgi:hypothetical protein